MTISLSPAANLEAQHACELGAAIPVHARAVIQALRFRSPIVDPLRGLSEPDWERALRFCDRSHLSLPLALRSGDTLPTWIRERLASDLQKNTERWRRTQIAYLEIADAFDEKEIEFAVLKGFSHCPHFVRDPRHRTQGDLDLLFAPEAVTRARDAAMRLGYEPIEGLGDLPIDHLPRMIRKTGWRWQGDFFDVEMPVSLELHFRLWDADTERFAPGGLEAFWSRREIRRLDSIVFPALDPADGLAYATLHLLRHLLRGDLRTSHVYELAAFLHDRTGDAAFWDRWNNLHSASLRKLEAIGFCLAGRWFDCDMPPAAAEEIARLPADTARWLETSPAGS